MADAGNRYAPFDAFNQTSEETCAHSPRALNGWRLITKPNADTVRLGIQTTSKVRA
jgi:hypothetical protein